MLCIYEKLFSLGSGVITDTVKVTKIVGYKGLFALKKSGIAVGPR